MTKPRHLLPVSEDILVFAFRYALGRQTAAPSIVVAQLKEHWNHGLMDYTKLQIQREIRGAIHRGEAGSECDVATWRLVLSWSKDECPKCQMVYYNCLCSHGD